MLRRVLVLLLLSVTAQAAWRLGKPVPRSQIGAMRGDDGLYMRSPYALEAGYFEASLNCFSFLHDQLTPTRDQRLTERLSFGALHLRLGLVDGLEMNLQTPAFTWLHLDNGKTITNTVGPGPIEFALRLGTPGQRIEPPVALAFMPWVRFPGIVPALGGDGWTFGFRLPMEFPIGQNLLHFQAGLRADAKDSSNLSAGWELGAALGRMIRRDYRVEVTLLGQGYFSQPNEWQAWAEVYLGWNFHPKWRVWVAARIAMTLVSPDFEPFLGIAVRP